MALMLGKLYDALRAADVPDQKARDAAEEVAGYDREIANLRTDMRVVQAVSGVLVVFALAVLWQLVGLRGEVSELHAVIGALNEKVGALDGRTASLDNRVGGLDNKLDAGFAGLGQRLEALAARLPR
jgi:hypothetical protein